MSNVLSAPEPSYYAVIPANVRYAKDLSSSAKLLYGEISALANKSGYCWATNQYFANLYEVDTRTVRRWIRQLDEGGFIRVVFKPKEYSPNETIRQIYLTSETAGLDDPKPKHVTAGETAHADDQQDQVTPQDAATSSDASADTPTDTQDDTQDDANDTNNADALAVAQTVIDHLNDVANKTFDVTIDVKQTLENWQSKGYTLDDFLRVVDLKTSQWVAEEKMNQYLRPQTLFGPKFTRYAEERPSRTQGASSKAIYREPIPKWMQKEMDQEKAAKTKKATQTPKQTLAGNATANTNVSARGGEAVGSHPTERSSTNAPDVPTTDAEKGHDAEGKPATQTADTSTPLTPLEQLEALTDDALLDEYKRTFQVLYQQLMGKSDAETSSDAYAGVPSDDLYDYYETISAVVKSRDLL